MKEDSVARTNPDWNHPLQCDGRGWPPGWVRRGSWAVSPPLFVRIGTMHGTLVGAIASWIAAKQNNRLGCALARRVLCRFALLLGAAIVFSSCSRKEAVAGKEGQDAAGAPVPVLVGKAEEKNMPAQITAIGNVQPFTKVAVRSQITGQL